MAATPRPKAPVTLTTKVARGKLPWGTTINSPIAHRNSAPRPPPATTANLRTARQRHAVVAFDHLQGVAELGGDPVELRPPGGCNLGGSTRRLGRRGLPLQDPSHPQP